MCLVCLVGVGLAVEQQTNHLEVAVLGGHLEPCGTVLRAVVGAKVNIGSNEQKIG